MVRILDLKRRNLIALAFAMVLLSSSFVLYRTNAAGYVDTEAAVTITATIDSNDTSDFAKGYEGDVIIDLYKIATLDASGNPTLTDDFKSSTADLSILSKKTTVADIESKIVEPIQNYVGSNSLSPIGTINASKNGTKLSSASISISAGAGIYYYVPRPASDSDNEYSFTSYIIYAPTSDYIKFGTGSDIWDYNSTFSLKAESHPRYGSIRITKTLDTFNESLGTASFVFDVEAVRDDRTVFSNVYTINFDDATTKAITINNIPANAVVTVKEVYTGASYLLAEGSEPTISDIIITAGEIAEANFTNDYDNRLIEGGIGIENHFVKSDDDAGVTFKFDGSNVSNTDND